MDLDVVFAGTAGSVPTPGRGLASVLLRRGGQRLLIDCGEGTQRQLMRSCGLADLDAIHLTHLHADHVLGLPGLLKTFGLRERTADLVITGPRGLAGVLQDLGRIIGRLEYEVHVEEVDDGWSMQLTDQASIEAFRTQHSVRSVGYRLVEQDRPGRFDVERARELGVTHGPDFGRLQRGQSVTLDDGTVIEPTELVGEARSGRSIVYTGDTRACARVREAAAGATLLIHEATFCLDEAERAQSTGHSTAHDAALTAAAADVGMLAVTHLSNRYGGREVLEEARAVFANSVCPRDFDLIELPFPERGEPVLVPRGARPGRGGSSPTDRNLQDDQPAVPIQAP